MRFFVAVKQVPDTMNVSVDEDGSLVRTGVPAVLDPYSEYALTQVLSRCGEDDTVTVFTMGPPQASDALRRCLELGADEAYLLTDPAFAGSDTWATSRVLAAFLEGYGCDADAVFFGRQATDGGTEQVPYETAQLLDVQQFAYAEDFSKDGDSLTVVQDYGDVRRTCRAPKGSVIAFGSADPNGVIPSLEGMVAASGKQVTELDRAALGLCSVPVGLKGSKTHIVRTETVKSSRRNRKVAISNPERAARSLLEQMEMMR